MTEQDITFKPIIWLFVQQYDSSKDSYTKRKLKEALKEALKKMTDQKVNMVSEAVFIACQEINQDPFELLWPKRNILGKDENGKSLLLWEHSTPLEEYFESLIKCKSETEVGEAIENYSGVCWLMRHEDNLLNKSGFRAKRPGGWEETYNKCGIKIIRK